LRFPRTRGYLAVIVAICAGIGVSTVAFLGTRKSDQERFEAEFREEAERCISGVKRDVQSGMQMLEFLRGYYAGSEHVDRDEFHEFVKPLLANGPTFQALEWTPRVPNSQRATCEEAARQEGCRGFRITERNGEGQLVVAARRDAYFPVFYVEPREGNEAALGFDLASDATRREALERARDTGSPTATSRIRLVQNVDDRFGVLIFQPIYRNGAPTGTIDDRRQNLAGFTLGVFTIGDVLAETIAYLGRKGIDLYMFDECARPGERLLALHPSRLRRTPPAPRPNEAELMSGLHAASRLNVGGRTWLLVCTPIPSWVAAASTWRPWAVLAIGVLFTGLLSAYLISMRVQHNRIHGLALFPDESRSPVLRVTADGAILYANPASRRWLDAWKRGVGEKVPEEWCEHVAEVIASKATREVEIECAGATFAIDFVPIVDAGYVNLYSRDITTRKRAEEALRTSREQVSFLADLIERSSQPFAVAYPDGRLDRCNAAFRQLVGYSSEELAAIDWARSLTPPEWADHERAQLERLRVTGQPVRYEKEYVRKDGSRVSVELLVHVVSNEHGEPKHYYGFITDITDRKRANAALKLQSSALQAAANGIVITDRTGTITWVNPAFTGLTGYTFEEAVGQNPRLLKSGKHDETFYRDLWGTITSGQVWHGETINRRKDGTLYTEEMTITPVLDERDAITHFVAIKQDITARKQAEGALRESEERHRVLFESSRDALMTLAPPAWNFTSCNPATLKMFEAKDAAEFASLGPGDASPEFQPDGRPSAEKAKEMIETAMREGSLFFEWAHKRLNGEVFPAAVLLTRMELGAQALLQATVRDITEQKQAEEALRAERDKAQNYLDIAGAAFLVLNADQRVALINRTGCEILGRPAEQIVGVNWFDTFLPERGRERIRDLFCKAMAGGEPLPEYVESAVVTPDGQEKLIAWHNTVTRDALGNAIGALSSGEDITERRRVEEALRESARQWQATFDAAGDGIWLMDDGQRIVRCNKAAAGILGKEMREIVGRPCWEVANASACPREECPFARMRRTLRRESTEVLLENRWLAVTVDPILDEGGALRGAVHVLSDITARKHSEQALRESEERFRTITASAQDAIIMMDNEGNISLWNEAAESIFGYTRAEVTGRQLHSLLGPERHLPQYHKAFPRFRETGQGAMLGKTLELRAVRKGGEEFPIELSLSAVKLNGSWHAIGILRDVGQRKRAEEALRKEHARTEQLLASISSILIGVDENESIVQWNTAAERTFAIDAREALGRRFRECRIPWAWAPVLEAIAACRTTGKPQRVDDLRYTRPEGKDGFLGITVTPVANEEGRLAGFLLAGADITERRILEAHLNQAQKLESIGQLAAGIAHEINTPTQFVGDNVRFLQDAFRDLHALLEKDAELLDACRRGLVTPELIAEVEAAVNASDLEYLSEEVPRAIEQSLDGVARVAKIVRAMKDFSHPGADDKKATDLNKAIESTITVARNEWKYVADLRTDLDPALPPVTCLPGDLNQAILNLIINAAHAIAAVVGDGASGKGTITVTTRRDGDWAEIRVRDTGCGIPEAIRSKVFDPFFTTKQVGKGTGQGLAIAHAVVVEKHGGTITFESEVGTGTTFSIRLPICPQPAPPAMEQTV
jgi:PAS domain S-box-containing protein